MSESISAHHDYWNTFYGGRRRKDVPLDPSAFAEWVKPELSAEESLVELGFGTGRDSLWFAQQGHQVRAYDFAESAVEAASERAEEFGLAAEFSRLDLYDDEQVEQAVARETGADGVLSVYARFLLHSLEAQGRTNAVRLAAGVVSQSGRLFLEFRTGKDQGTEHLFGEDHFRAYLDPEDVLEEIESSGGTLTHMEQGHGLAVYKSEDPHVARIVARWER